MSSFCQKNAKSFTKDGSGESLLSILFCHAAHVELCAGLNLSMQPTYTISIVFWLL